MFYHDLTLLFFNIYFRLQILYELNVLKMGFMYVYVWTARSRLDFLKANSQRLDCLREFCRFQAVWSALCAIHEPMQWITFVRMAVLEQHAVAPWMSVLYKRHKLETPGGAHFLCLVVKINILILDYVLICKSFVWEYYEDYAAHKLGCMTSDLTGFFACFSLKERKR